MDFSKVQTFISFYSFSLEYIRLWTIPGLHYSNLSIWSCSSVNLSVIQKNLYKYIDRLFNIHKSKLIICYLPTTLIPLPDLPSTF